MTVFVDNTALDVLLRSVVFAVIAFGAIIVYIRMTGLRALSKMTIFDFAMTVAVGSLLASATTAGKWSALWQAVLGAGVLFAAQYALARLRKHSDAIEDTLTNQSVLLMRDGVIDDDALEATRVSRHDLFAKLREANVLTFGDVRAVVLETTGDISVLHGPVLDENLLEGVQRV